MINQITYIYSQVRIHLDNLYYFSCWNQIYSSYSYIMNMALKCTQWALIWGYSHQLNNINNILYMKLFYAYIYIYIYIYTHTVMAKNIDTLGKYDQRRLWKLICIVHFLIFYFNNSQKYFYWIIRPYNGGKYHYEINVFLKYTLATINGTLIFYTFWNVYLPV